MNDPHVVGLEYSVEHGSGIDWSKASPLEVQQADFAIGIDNKQVRFNFIKHFATEREARAFVENDFLGNWEFDVALKRGPNAFKLRFERAEIVDRNPAAGVPSLSAHVRSGLPKVHVRLAPPTPRSYPQPPSVGLKRTPDVASMFNRYLGYLEGREPLPAMAYFCLTVLENTKEVTVMLNADPAANRNHKRRRAAADHFGIAFEVLRKIGELSSERGGASARKAGGRDKDLSSEQLRWLEFAVKTVIRRAAEVAHDPHARSKRITCADLNP